MKRIRIGVSALVILPEFLADWWRGGREDEDKKMQPFDTKFADLSANFTQRKRR